MTIHIDLRYRFISFKATTLNIKSWSALVGIVIEGVGLYFYLKNSVNLRVLYMYR